MVSVVIAGWMAIPTHPFQGVLVRVQLPHYLRLDRCCFLPTSTDQFLVPTSWRRRQPTLKRCTKASSVDYCCSYKCGQGSPPCFLQQKQKKKTVGGPGTTWQRPKRARVFDRYIDILYSTCVVYHAIPQTRFSEMTRPVEAYFYKCGIGSRVQGIAEGKLRILLRTRDQGAQVATCPLPR